MFAGRSVPVAPSLAYRRRGVDVEWTIVAVNFLYAALGVVLMYASYRIIDLVTPNVDFAVELKNGNVAVAIFIAALFVAIAIIIGGALN
jgi:uncharacterized membrane protein YjfL (UPF0719 family)